MALQDDIMAANNRRTIRVNVWDYPSVKCQCGSELFTAATIFKTIPGVVAGTGAEPLQQPVPVYVCMKCGELMPLYQEDIKKAEEARKFKDQHNAHSSIIL